MKISDYQVLRSAAGYYIGRTVEMDGIPIPYDRVGGYFRSRSDAQKELDAMKRSFQNSEKVFSSPARKRSRQYGMER
jgi:hypothetical protein